MYYLLVIYSQAAHAEAIIIVRKTILRNVNTGVLRKVVPQKRINVRDNVERYFIT